MIEFSPLTAETLPSVKAFLLPFWQRAWSESLSERMFNWRFLERPHGETILALEDERCVAMVDSFVRDYQINTELTYARETADWYSLPKARGMGLQPIWMMMRKPEPIIGIGGSAMTMSLLPRLKWKPLPQQAYLFILNLNRGLALEKLARRVKLPGTSLLIQLAQRLPIPTSRMRPQISPSARSNIRSIESTDTLTGTAPALSDYGFARLVSLSEIEWLKSAPPEMGQFFGILFSLDGKPIGFSVSRVYSQEYSTAATILHIQTSQVSTEVYAWIASETTARLVDEGARFVSCLTTCDRLAEGLRLTGFHQQSMSAPMWWSNNDQTPQGAALLSNILSDNGIRPYPV